MKEDFLASSFMQILPEGPVRGGDRQARHNFKHPITLNRGNRSKSVGFEVNTSEDFMEKETRSDDRKELVGPIYSSGRIADERVHHFTQGYQAPLSAEQKAEKMKLVNKFFQQQQKEANTLQQKVVAKAERLQQQYEVRSHSAHSETRVSREEALRQGEQRRQEAVARRQEFLQEQQALSQQDRMAAQQQRFLRQQQEQRDQEGGGQRQVCQAWQQEASQTQVTQNQSHQESQTKSQQISQTNSQQLSQTRSQQVSQTKSQQISQTKSQQVSQTQQFSQMSSSSQKSSSSESSSQKTVISQPGTAQPDRSALEEAARRLSATVKTRQQVEAERDAMVSLTVQR